MTEINVVRVETDDSQEVCAFTSPDEAVSWFKKFMAMGKNVSITRVEVDSSKDFILIED